MAFAAGAFELIERAGRFRNDCTGFAETGEARMLCATMAELCRDHWLNLADAELLRQCMVDTYRASGPGGQKRNKTESAVRLRHGPTGLTVIAEESRSQHENKSRAVKRLRQAICTGLRQEITQDQLAERDFPGIELVQAAIDRRGRLQLGRRDERYWRVAAVVLDVLAACHGRLRPTANALGITTANLVEFLYNAPQVWAEANRLRRRFGEKALKHR